MELALYAPGLGYYSAGQQKFGAAGDFVTSPHISPLFASALANQLAQWLQQTTPQIVEFGAGDGQLAAQLLIELNRRSHSLERYCIVEVSADLKQRQYETIKKIAPRFLSLVVWHDQLPAQLEGVVIGNELLDAMPVKLFELQAQGVVEKGVRFNQLQASGQTSSWSLQWEDRPAKHEFATEIAKLLQSADTEHQRDRPLGYTSEVCTVANAWMHTIASRLKKGAMLLIDYGFPRAEYYLPARSGGTIMCHYRHYAHSDPLLLPGLQDITAHVDFSAVAQQALDSGLELLGYTSQARFLINCGLISELSSASHQLDATQTIALNSGVQRLVSEAEMGELFKVIGFCKNLEGEVSLGFTTGDRSHTLGLI